MADYDDITTLSVAELTKRSGEIVRSLRDSDLTGDEQAEITLKIAAGRDQIAGELTSEIDDYRWAVAAVHSSTAPVLTTFWLVLLGALCFVLSRFHLSPGWLSPSLVATSLAVTASGVLPVALWRNRRLARNRLAADVLNSAVERTVTLRVNQLVTEMQTVERRWSNTFTAIDAPALVELNVADTTPSSTLAKVLDFVLEHDASTVGIAGPRGSGKSTLARQVSAHPAVDVGTEVSAPVSYEANEFTRIIHGELARAIGGRSSSPLSMPRGRPFRTAIPFLAAFIVLILFLVGFYTDKNSVEGANSEILRYNWSDSFDVSEFSGVRLGWTGIVCVVGAGAALGYLAVRAWLAVQAFHAGTRPPAAPATLPELGTNARNFLAWTTTVERSAKTKIGAGDRLQFEGATKMARAQRELTHAESVQELRQFLRELVAMITADRGFRSTGPKVVVCIDELDKMDKPDEVIRTINGLKDLFHIDGVHFLLSVSTDALARFAARGVPVRDAFDSSFDTIVRMAPLTVEEARKLLARRARGFSSTAGLFCFAWSGGNARDLIRVARACVAHRRGSRADLPLGEVASAVLRSQIIEIIDAMTADTLDGATDETLQGLLDLGQRLADVKVSIEEARRLFKVDQPLVFQDDTRSAEVVPASAFGGYLELAALTERLFAVRRTPDQWRSAEVIAAVTALANARGSLGRHPVEVRRLIDAAARGCTTAFDAEGTLSVATVASQP